MRVTFLITIILSFFIQFSVAQTIEKIKMDDVLKLIDTVKTPVVINFWATWCHPCVEEIPLLEKSIISYKSQGAKLILISVDFANDYSTKLIPFVLQHGYTSKIYWLDEKNPAEFCPRLDSHWAGKIPATLMINNAKNYREFYNIGLAQYQIDAYLKDLILR